MQGNAHQLKDLEFAKQTILLFCLSVHRGSAGKGCQLHPMKAKIRFGQIIYRIVQMHPHLPGFVCSYAYLYPSVRSSVRPSIQSSVRQPIRQSLYLLVSPSARPLGKN